MSFLTRPSKVTTAPAAGSRSSAASDAMSMAWLTSENRMADMVGTF